MRTEYIPLTDKDFGVEDNPSTNVSSASHITSEGASIETEWQEQKPLYRPLPEPDPFPVDALGDTLGGAVEAMSEIIQAPKAICANSNWPQPHWQCRVTLMLSLMGGFGPHPTSSSRSGNQGSGNPPWIGRLLGHILIIRKSFVPTTKTNRKLTVVRPKLINEPKMRY